MTVLIPGIYGLDATTAFRTFSKDPQKYLDRFAKDPTVKKEIAYFESKAPKFKDVDALLKDRRALQYLLDSYGLGSEINNIGRIKKVLTEDPTASSSLVNRLVDTRFKAMAESLRLDQGMTKLQRITFRDTLEDKYVLNEFEENLGSQDPALRQAAYFARNAGSISDVYGILGDSVIRDVVTTVFNLPKQIAIQPVETQARLISSKIDFKKLGALNTSNVSAASLKSAKTDYALIEKNLGISDAASTQVKALQDKLAQLVSDYETVDTITDVNGSNAATIALQQTAVPELVRFEQLLRAGNKSIDNVSGLTDTLLDLVSQARDADSDLNDLKTQFTSIVNSITTAIGNADITAPDGSTQNILSNSTNDTVTITLNDTGTTVTINRYNASDLQSLLSTAQTAFNAVTDSNDESNLNTVQARLLTSKDRINTINTTIESDLSALQSTTGTTLFAATLNNTQLIKGKQSIDDGLSRINQIEGLLDKISALAVESADRLPSADRSDLDASFTDYRNQIRDLITTTDTAGLDNFLNNAPDYSYEIRDGKSYVVKSGYDLLSSIADVLDTGSLLTQQDAQALELTAIQVTNNSDRLKTSLSNDKLIMDRLTGTYDPYAKLQLQVYDLGNALSDAVTNAAKDNANLLDVTQSDIKLNNLSSGTTLTFAAQPNFLSSTQSALADVITQFGNGATAIGNALDGLKTIVDRVKFNLDMDNRRATLEYGRLGGVIDVLEPKEQASTGMGDSYKTNSFTEKFIARYLMLAGGKGGTTSGPNSFLLSLYGGTGDTSGAISTIQSLSVQA